MAEMSVIWLRVAAALYSLGLLHAILTLVRRREHLFRVALGAFGLGAVFHFVSIVEEGIVNNRCPIGNFYETLSMCAFLIVVLYLFVHWRYQLDSLSVFIFPLVFVMTLVATMGNPVSAWSSPVVRNAWLTVHIVLVLLGIAALLFTAVASLLYLFQERELKTKKPRKFYYRLPALGTLDDLISQVHGRRLRADDAGGDRRQHLGLHRTEDRTGSPSRRSSSRFFTWGVYMALVFLRTTAGWRGRKAAIMTVTVLGFSRPHLGRACPAGHLLLKP